MTRLVVALLALSVSTLHAEEIRSITVTAKSEIKVAPDEVVLQLGIHRNDKELLAAKQANDKATAAVLALADKHSIPSNDVKIVDLEVSPVYDDFGNRIDVLIGYDVIRDIEVRLTDFDNIEPFLSDAFAAGANGVNDLHFRVSNQRQHQFEARKLAVTYAREKAEHLTELTGMKLGRPIRIEENIEHNWNAAGFGGMGYTFSDDSNSKFASMKKSIEPKDSLDFVAFQEPEDDDKQETFTAPGQIIISAHVTVEYEMTVHSPPMLK